MSLINFNENKHFYKSTIFYLLLIFLLYLVLNLYFSININNSILRVIKFALIIFLVKEMQKIIIYDQLSFEKIINFWVIIFILVSFDILFEFIFGFNTLGIKSPIWGRISSFFGDELVAGSFYHFLSLIVLAFFLKKKYSNKSIIILAGSIIIISFIIGERANFIRLLISVFLFLFLTLKISLIKKVGSFALILISISLIFVLNGDLNKRYYHQLKTLYSINGIEKYYKQSQYGAHQETAYQIFKNNFYFGIGIKNFRDESRKKKYKNENFEKTDWRQATHPHQLHLELLSETGLIGYLLFLFLIFYSLIISFKKYLIFKNNYLLASIIFLLSSLIPVIPTGSLFSTFYGGIFWFNFSLMIGLNNYSKS